MKYLIGIFLFSGIYCKAFSWSLKTHVFIAREVLADIMQDGSVTAFGKRYPIPLRLEQALRNYPHVFLMGSLGPDIFPDPVAGQTTCHPGVKDAWQTDDWLKHLLKNAKTEQELAFSYGFIIHAASDAFAHTYVNNFAGGIFNLRNHEREIETRHFALEKFIEKFTPQNAHKGIAAVELSTKDLPFDFIVKQLILDSCVKMNYASSGNFHLYSMANVRQVISDLIIKHVDNDRSFSFLKELYASNKSREALKKVKSSNDVREGKKNKSSVKDMKMEEFIQREQGEILTLETEVSDFPSYGKQQLKDVDAALNDYIRSSAECGILLHNESKGVDSVYRAWFRRYNSVFIGIPDNVKVKYINLKERISKNLQDLLSFLGLQKYVDEYNQLRRDFNTCMTPPMQRVLEFGFKKAGESGLYDLIGFVSGFNSINEIKLNDIYSRQGQKNLSFITFDTVARPVSNIILRDMSVRNLQFDRENFGPIKNSIVLSKISLLGVNQLNALIRDKVGNYISPLYGPIVYTSTLINYSLLFDAIRNIDGNHQWQEFGLPYPQRDSTRYDTLFQYGYGYDQNDKKGFKLWVDPMLRDSVFNKLFTGSVTGYLSEERELKSPAYPFPQCEKNPFPSVSEAKGRVHSCD